MREEADDGNSTEHELTGYPSIDKPWLKYYDCVKYYDKEIELCADYRPKKNICPEDVWQSVADIQNIQISNATHVQYARELVAREKRQDFQRRFEDIEKEKTDETL